MRRFSSTSAFLCVCLMLSGHALAARQLRTTTYTPSPTYETPSPVYTPSPNYKPSPSYPSPSYEEYPSPSYPSPSYPSPTYEEPSYPSPSYETPSPSYETPSPSYETPSPSYETPSPSYEEPSYPSPSYTYPSPSYTEESYAEESSEEEGYTPEPAYKRRMMTEKYYKDESKSYKHKGYSSYPVCSLPAPFETRNLHTSFSHAGEFKACVELSGKRVSNQVQAFDLAALQLVVSDKCYHAVKSVTFDDKRVKPELKKYEQEHNIGVKISGYDGDVLATYRDLYKSPAKVCITLKFPCANQDSLYNIVTYFAEGGYEADYCATTSLFNNNSYHKEQYKYEEPKYPTQKY